MRVVLFLAELFAPLGNVDKCVHKLPLIFFVCSVISQKFSHNAVSKTVVLMKYGYGCVNDIQVITFSNIKSYAFLFSKSQFEIQC